MNLGFQTMTNPEFLPDVECILTIVAILMEIYIYLKTTF